MRHNKMKTRSLEIWKEDNQNHLVLPTSASPEHFYLCHSIHSISKTSHKSLLSVLEHFTYINGGILHYFAHIFAEESPVHMLPPAKPLDSDDIVEHLLLLCARCRHTSEHHHDTMLQNLVLHVRTENRTPPPAAAAVIADISRQGGRAEEEQLWSGLGLVVEVWRHWSRVNPVPGPETRGLGSVVAARPRLQTTTNIRRMASCTKLQTATCFKNQERKFCANGKISTWM